MLCDSSDNRIELKAIVGGINDFKNSYQYDTLNRLSEFIQQGQSGGNAVTAKHFLLAYNAID